MTMSPSEIVQRHLEAFLAGPESELTSIAAKHQALPVYSDMGGSLFITCSACEWHGWPSHSGHAVR
jgi:hypothetical protein